jgi:hypothetical protein
VQHAQMQAQIQAQMRGLVALPTGAAFGAPGAAQLMGGAGGLCLVPYPMLPAGSHAPAGIAGMHAAPTGGWMPQMNAAAAAAVGMQKPFVQSAEDMQRLQAAQGAAGFAMQQWPQGRCT